MGEEAGGMLAREVRLRQTKGGDSVAGMAAEQGGNTRPGRHAHPVGGEERPSP